MSTIVVYWQIYNNIILPNIEITKINQLAFNY